MMKFELSKFNLNMTFFHGSINNFEVRHTICDIHNKYWEYYRKTPMAATTEKFNKIFWCKHDRN